MAATLSTLMTAEPHLGHTLAETHCMVALQATRYLASHPLRLDSTPFTTRNARDDAFWTLLERLMSAVPPPPAAPSFRRRMPILMLPRGDHYGHYGHYGHGYRRDYGNRSIAQRQPPRPVPSAQRPNGPVTSPLIFSDLLHEELILSLSAQITYRRNCLRQATRYKELLRSDMADCEDFDVKRWMDGNMHGPVKFYPYRCILKRAALERVLGLIDKADLFERPGREGWGKEEKAPLYLFVALIEKMTENGWEDSYRGNEIAGFITELARARHDVKRGNVHQPTRSIEHRGQQMA